MKAREKKKSVIKKTSLISIQNIKLNNLPFDLHTGFVMKNLTLDHPGDYKCISQGDDEDIVFLTIHVSRM